MANLEAGPIYSKMGQLIAEDVRAKPIGAFLFAEAGDGWGGGAIFQDMGDRIIYRTPSQPLLDQIIAAWKAKNEDKRWSDMHYMILDGRFMPRWSMPSSLIPKRMFSTAATALCAKGLATSRSIIPIPECSD